MADAPVFQFDPQGGVQTPQGGPTPRGPSVGITGGGNILSQPVKFDGAPDANVSSQLPSFLEEAFAPALNKAKQDAMWQGFTAARSGQSMQQIHDEQPWFSKVFGPTNFEMGAQLYSVQGATNKVMTQFTQNLPTLAKMSSEELGGTLNQMAQSAMTGDQYTDALIQKSLMDNAGSMLDMHAKARYAWQQQTLSQAQYTAGTSASTAFNSAMTQQAALGISHPNQQMPPEQTAELTRTFLQQFQSPQGQDPVSYRNNLVAMVGSMADSGEFHSINAIRQSGILQLLTPEQQEQLDQRIDRGETSFNARMAFDPAIAQYKTQIDYQAALGLINPETVFSAYSSINQQYAAKFGIDTPLIPMSGFEHTAESAGAAVLRIKQAQLEHAMRLQEAAANRQATLEEKQAATEKLQGVLADAAATGYIGALKGQQGVTSEMLDSAMSAAVNSHPAQTAQLLTQALFTPRSNYTSQAVQKQIQLQTEQSAGVEKTPAFDNVYNLWKSFQNYQFQGPDGQTDTTSGKAAAATYFGKYNAPMQVYDRLVSQQVDPKIAYRQAFGEGIQNGVYKLGAASPDQLAAARSALASAVSDKNPGWMHPFTTDLAPSTQQLLANMATRHYMDLTANDPTWQPKDAAAKAIAMTMSPANGRGAFEVGGRYGWISGPDQVTAGAAMANLNNGNGMDTAVFGDLFAHVADAKLKAAGISPSNASIHPVRLEDSADGPNIAVTATDNKGNTRTIIVTGKDIQQRNEQERTFTTPEQIQAGADAKWRNTHQPTKL